MLHAFHRKRGKFKPAGKPFARLEQAKGRSVTPGVAVQPQIRPKAQGIAA
jgi:hypothetical protein